MAIAVIEIKDEAAALINFLIYSDEVISALSLHFGWRDAGL